MKNHYSEEYYRTNWERFLKKVPGKHYVNMEQDLNQYMKAFSNLPDDAIEVIRNVKAKDLAETMLKLVIEEMKTIKDIESGISSFGFTTRSQEISYTHDFIQRFEFNCIQLSDFKKKYNID